MNIDHLLCLQTKHRGCWYLKSHTYIWDNFGCEFVLSVIIHLKPNLKVKEWSSCANRVTRMMLAKEDGEKQMRTLHTLSSTQRTTNNYRMLRMEIKIYPRKKQTNWLSNRKESLPKTYIQVTKYKLSRLFLVICLYIHTFM